MTPTAFNHALSAVQQKFQDHYLVKLGITADDKVLQLIMASNAVYKQILFHYLLENAFFDEPGVIL